MLTLTLAVGVNSVDKGYQRCRGLFAQLACTNNDTRMLLVALSRFITRRNGKMRTTYTYSGIVRRAVRGAGPCPDYNDGRKYVAAGERVDFPACRSNGG